MENNFFHRLVSIPLFQGISRDDFMNIASKIHFDFHTCQAGEVIVSVDENCKELVCVISGSVIKEVRSEDGSYLFREINDKPDVLQPDRLFGLRPRYSATFIAAKETSILTIPKDEVRDILFDYVTFHINYLNLICSATQLWEGRLWKQLPDELEQRFVYFVQTRATRPAGHKELVIGMVNLARELVTTRLNVSRMLNQLKRDDLIYLQRGLIIIPEFEKLVQRQKQ